MTAHAINAMVWGSLALWLTGCATQYRKPCTVDIQFTLDERGAVDNYCKRHVAVLDDGTAPKWNTTYLGCASGARGTIHAVNDPGVWAHEIAHVLDYHCGKN